MDGYRADLTSIRRAATSIDALLRDLDLTDDLVALEHALPGARSGILAGSCGSGLTAEVREISAGAQRYAEDLHEAAAAYARTDAESADDITRAWHLR